MHLAQQLMGRKQAVAANSTRAAFNADKKDFAALINDLYGEEDE